MMRRILVPAVLLALVVAACAAPATSEAPASPGAASPGTATPAPTDPRFGGRLVVAYPGDVVTLDAMASTAQPTAPRSAIFETLTAQDGGMQAQPALAESWTVSDDGLTWTFVLRSGVTFHNGETLTANDVVASWDRFRAMGARAAEFSLVDTVTAVDQGTVAFKLNTVDGGFGVTLGQGPGAMSVIPKSVADRIGDGEMLELGDIIGTGPYQISEWEPGRRVLLTRFDQYSQPSGEPSYVAGTRAAYFDEVEILSIDDSETRVAALLKGEVDLIHNVPGDSVGRIASSNDAYVVPTVPGGRIYWKFNATQGPFTDPVLRQAVRTGLKADDLMQGVGPRDFWRVNHTIRYQQEQWPWIDQSDTYPEDMERALELVAESSYKGELIRILTTEGRDDEAKTVIPMDQYLRDLGLNVRVDTVDNAAYGDLRKDLSVWDFKPSGGGSVAGVTVLQFAAKDRNGNLWANVSEDWNQLVDELRSTVGQDKQLEVIRRLYDRAAEQNNELWFGDVHTLVGARSDIKGVPTDDFTLSFWNIWREN